MHLECSQWAILFFNFFWQQNQLYSYFSNNNNSINNNNHRTLKRSESKNNEQLWIISLMSKHVLKKGVDTRRYFFEFELTYYPFQDTCWETLHLVMEERIGLLIIGMYAR